MSAAAGNPADAPPAFDNVMGHPRPLWMLFMSEFWERFAFYGIRWALVLYIVAQFHGGDPSGQQPASFIYGSYLALVYAAAIFGGYVADRFLGYQRAILVGAAFMSIGLFMIAVPHPEVFKLGLATIIVGNGLFKPIISTLVGKIYAQGDERRDSGFTIFYMGINAGALVAPVLTGLLARQVFGADGIPDYKVVFIAAGIGMLLSWIWFYFGRAQLQGVGAALNEAQGSLGRMIFVLLGATAAIPVAYSMLVLGSLPLYQVLGISPSAWNFFFELHGFLGFDALNLSLGWLLRTQTLQLILTAMFLALAVMLLIEGVKNGPKARDMVIAMLIIFAFNIMFWMFFEQAGSSFNFLADEIVRRDFGSWTFPLEWFQSVNSLAIITLAPLMAWLWVKMGRANPSIPRKFGLGLIFNGLAFLLLMYALSSLVGEDNKIPFWTLFMVYVIQSVGELCLSPIGLSMVTKLAPVRLVGFGMGGWFLSTGIGNNLSGIFAGHVSGEGGMTVASALTGYTFGFWALVIPGAVLFIAAPLVGRLMHGVK